MSPANKLVFFRMILAPVFFIIYLLPGFFLSWFVHGAAWTVPALWLIIIIWGITGLIDYLTVRILQRSYPRKQYENSDSGNLLGPLSGTLMLITCFFCFVIDRIFPAILFLLVIYLEFSDLFIRNLTVKKGIAMDARLCGKIKNVSGIASAAAALLFVSLLRLSIFDYLLPFFRTGVLVIFFISVILSIVSFFDCLSAYLKAGAAK